MQCENQNPFANALAILASAALILISTATAFGEDATIRVNLSQPGRPVSPYLTGACIEDVNHEIYGGIYSQMIFGESFQEPPRREPVKNFLAIDGEWSVKNGQVSGGDGPGPKLISTMQPFSKGEVGVDVFLPGSTGAGVHNGGLIVKVNRPSPGADNFDGYEISIDAGRGVVSLGRHRHNWNLLAEVKTNLAMDRWINLSAKLTERTIDVLVDGKTLIQYEDTDRPLISGSIGLRNWQRQARYRNFWARTGERRIDLPFEASPNAAVEVSGMWRPIHIGTALLLASIEKEHPFVGAQSQRIEHAGGDGEVGIENQGLNRSGLSVLKGKSYEGYLWVQAEKPADIYVSLESRDGNQRHAEAKLVITAGDWHRYDFTLTPTADDQTARFAIRLKSPGPVILGHAFLQPGSWGRFKDLPLRRDVVQGLIDQGISVLRYGGSMVNAPEYRWKKMIGPRDRRLPYKGTWYTYSTNGWGIIDFLNLCEAAGFLAIPDFNIDESPQDMADFIEYVNGPTDSEWGRRRAADGHPNPYNLRHLELGNEEKIDDTYFTRFEKLAGAIWAKDANVILIVGDFQYERPITDPMRISGADSGINSLAAHKKILDLAQRAGREVWFDVHVWTEGLGTPSALAFPSYVDAINRLAEGAKHRVVVFEFNANTHDQRRALANAVAIGAIARDGRVPVALSANCLQTDGQNDNGWDQGLLFLNPSKVWLQPPGYVTQMIARSRLPIAVPTKTTDVSLDVTAECSDDRKTIVLRVVNTNESDVSAALIFDGFAPAKPAASVIELAGPFNAVNTAGQPDTIVPRSSEFSLKKEETIRYTFPRRSFTVLRFQ